MISFKLALPIVCVTACVSCGAPAPSILRDSQVVSAERAASHVRYLASDALLGRNTPSPGLDSAAVYIARTFAEAGLQPVHGSYFQEVVLNTVALGDTNTLALTMAGHIEHFVLKDDFVPFDMTANNSVSGDIVFAGYGIVAPEYGYDDYAELDVKGKIVAVLRHEPGEEDTASVFNGRKSTDYSNVLTKVRIAMERGAAGLLVMTDPLNHRSLTPRGFAWPSLSRTIPQDALPMTLVVEESAKIPVLHIGERVITRLFGSVDSLRAIQAGIDASVSPRSYPLTGISGTMRTSTSIRVHATRNVVGLMPGTDPRSELSVVIVGAHYDHVGYKKNSPAGTDSIYNGADDNASGTAALLEVAAALGASGSRPARPILLVAFTGEEKGLFGSQYYAQHPLFPLAETVAMLNMDMVGRNDPDSLLLIVDDRDSSLMRIAREENTPPSFILTRSYVEAGGSDHLSFSKHTIPVLFFHSGLHAEYHRVADEAHRVNAEKIARVAGLVFRTARRLAEAPLQ